MTSTNSISEKAQFRNGQPCRMAAWMHVKYSRLMRRQHRFVRLNGEVLSFHPNEKSKAEPNQIFDVIGAHIEFNDRDMTTSSSLQNVHQQNQFNNQPFYNHQQQTTTRKHYYYPSSKQIRISTAGRVHTLILPTVEETQSWGNSLLFASRHRFEDCYTLGKFIAEGTFSRIHKCHAIDDPFSSSNTLIHDDVDDDSDDDENSSKQQTFIVKIVKRRHNDEEASEWLKRERHVNSLLNSNTIVQMYDMFSTVEKDYLVFEYMKGGTLGDLLRKRGISRPLPETYSKNVIKQLFLSLHYIHTKNIVHRDVHPDNIFLSAKKFPMSIALGDFGLSNFVDDKTINSNVLTSMVGIPPYLSADVARRIPYGPSSDMWSAGVVLYQILSGDLPFKGKTARDVVERIKAGKFAFLHDRWKSVSEDAKSLIRQLLQIDPTKRITALASLQHIWLVGNSSIYPSRPLSMQINSSLNNLSYADRDSPGTTSNDGYNNNSLQQFSRSSGNMMPSSLSNFSRVASSASSISATISPPQSRDKNKPEKSTDWQPQIQHSQSLMQQPKLSKERQSSSMGVMAMPPSLRQLHHVSSVSSLSNAGVSQSQQPKLQMTPSVRAIQEKGLVRVTSDNPARMKKLLSSRVVQKQLSMALPYRRKFVVVGRAFVAVFRLRAISKGHTTRQLSKLDTNGQSVDVDAFIKIRSNSIQVDSARSSTATDIPLVEDQVHHQKQQLNPSPPSPSSRQRQHMSLDGVGRKVLNNGLKHHHDKANVSPTNGRIRGHVRHRSREIASNIMSKLTSDRSLHEATAAVTLGTLEK